MRPVLPMRSAQEPLPLTSCLAKTRVVNGCNIAGRTVEEHCLIAGTVSRALLERITDAWPMASQVFPENSWLAAQVHDVGKVCPTFQKKMYDRLGDSSLPQLENVDASLEGQWGKHASVSSAALMSAGASENFAKCVGLHHGDNISEYPNDHPAFGGKAWGNLRLELIEKLKAGHAWPDLDSLTKVLLVGGLAIVSDWIASGDIFSEPDQDWHSLINMSLDFAGFSYATPLPSLSFQDIFGFSPNSCQEAVSECVNGLGVFLLEAPMGIGKTEAALFATYNLISAKKACGLYFALPTQISSNLIHERIEKFMIKSFSGPADVILAHSQAKTFKQDGQSWFDGRYRALLAPYVTGTVDQALMAVLRVPFAPIRLFGLAGKVVVLDEIHSFDAYTSYLLDELIGHLVQIGSTVIILSATLSQKRRSEIIARTGAKAIQLSKSYPVLTCVKEGNIGEKEIIAQENKGIAVNLVNADHLAINEVIARAEDSQQCLWIENTVGKAQEIYEILVGMTERVEIELLHSRFTLAHRTYKEQYWANALGKNGYRPKGRILVGTQVVEQSLDLDADFLVSRFAPSDLLLQRLGRLWRHERSDRNPLAEREAWFLTLGADSQKVYSQYVIMRSLEVWGCLGKIYIPCDMRRIIEQTYAERKELAGSPLALELEKERRKVAQKVGQALQGISQIGQILDENAVGTRLLDVPMVDVLLLGDIDWDNEMLTLMSGGKGCMSWKCWPVLVRNTVSVPFYMAPAPLAEKVWKKIGFCSRVLLVGEEGGVRDAFGDKVDWIRYDGNVGYMYLK